MSKKKKFPGKKTKLAEHALTHVLEQEKSGASQPPEPLSSSLTLARAVQALRNDQLHLDLPALDGPPIPTQRQLETANIFLGILQVLEEMRELLRPPDVPARPSSTRHKPWSLPGSEIINYSLQIIGKTLREIKALMH